MMVVFLRMMRNFPSFSCSTTDISQSGLMLQMDHSDINLIPQLAEWLSLANLLNLALSSRTLWQRCQEPLQQQIKKLTPMSSNPIDITMLVHSIIRNWTWYHDLDIGDELFFPLPEILFRAALIGNKKLIRHLLPRAGDCVEAVLYGCLFGRRTALLQELTNIITTPHLSEFTQLLNQDVIRNTTAPILNKSAMELLGIRGYRVIIKYWYWSTPDPSRGLDLLAKGANLETLRFLAGSPFWYIPNGQVALERALTTEDTLLLDFMLPPGGNNNKAMFVHFPKDIYPGATIVNNYYRRRGVDLMGQTIHYDECAWLHDCLRKPLHKDITSANIRCSYSQILGALDLGQDVNRDRDLLMRAANTGNQQLMLAITNYYGTNNPFLLATALVPDSEQRMIDSVGVSHLLSHYENQKLLTPLVALSIVSRLSPKRLISYLGQHIFSSRVNINLLFSYYLTEPKYVEQLVHYFPLLEPWLTVRLLALKNNYEQYESRFNVSIVGAAIALLTGEKSNIKTMDVLHHQIFRERDTESRDRLLLLQAKHTMNIQHFLRWFGSSGLRTPALLQKVGEILCSRVPESAGQSILADINIMLATPAGIAISFEQIYKIHTGVSSSYY